MGIPDCVGEMKLLTKGKFLKDVARNWKDTYFRVPYLSAKSISSWYDKEKKNIYDNLLKAKTEKEIDEIIGNNSWTYLHCFECDKEVEALILLNGVMEKAYNNGYCGDCIAKAFKLLKGK